MPHFLPSGGALERPQYVHARGQVRLALLQAGHENDFGSKRSLLFPIHVLRLWVLSQKGGFIPRCTGIMLKGTHLVVVFRICARYHDTEHALRVFDQVIFGSSTTSRFEVVYTRLANADKWISEFGSTGG